MPRKLLERRFSDEVLEDVKQTILTEASQKAVEEKGLKPIGDPSFDNVAFEPDKDCVFEITLEVEPDFDLPGLQGPGDQARARDGGRRRSHARPRRPAHAARASRSHARRHAHRRRRRHRLRLENRQPKARPSPIRRTPRSTSTAAAPADSRWSRTSAEALAGAKFGESRESQGQVPRQLPRREMARQGWHAHRGSQGSPPPRRARARRGIRQGDGFRLARRAEESRPAQHHPEQGARRAPSPSSSRLSTSS